jgi:hypothetical protein
MGKINKLFHISEYTLFKIVYFSIIIITFFSAIILFYIGRHSTVNINTYKGSSDIIFSNSLYLIFSIIGVLIAMVVFLAQYINQKFNIEELDKSPISNIYYIITLFILFAYIIFNFVSIYLNLQFPYKLISLIFSISVILLIIMTIWITLYYFNYSNILKIETHNINKFIKHKVSNRSHLTNKNFNELSEKIRIFIRISIKAIHKDQDGILKISLECLENIVNNYLIFSNDHKLREDIFLIELNNQFNFMLLEGLKCYNQKYLEYIGKTIGNISKNIEKKREGIGYNHNLMIYWLRTLNNLFIKSYSKDRTSVCQICLEKINEILLLTLDNGHLNNYNSYKRIIDEIAENHLAIIDEYWAANLLQRILTIYQKQFLKFTELTKLDKIYFSDIFIKEYFDKFAKIINKAKLFHKLYMSYDVIFSSLYGVESFSFRIAEIGLQNLKKDKTKIQIANYIKYFIYFNYNILINNPENNDNRIYFYFPETLFLITELIDFKEENKQYLVELLSNNLIYCIKRESDDRIFYLSEDIICYFALLIYLYKYRTDIIEDTINKLVILYEKEKKNNNDKIIILLYSKLKLFSYWINNFPELHKINKPLIELLGRDINQYDISDEKICSLLGEYGYPKNIYSGGHWYLHPSKIWGYKFQEEISNTLNGENDQSHIKFHELLKNKIKNKEK